MDKANITPVAAIAVVAVGLLLIRRGGISLDMADVKPSPLSWVTVGLLSASFILVGKWLTTQYYVGGLTELFQAI